MGEKGGEKEWLKRRLLVFKWWKRGFGKKGSMKENEILRKKNFCLVVFHFFMLHLLYFN